MINTIRHTIEKHDLIPPAIRLVVGVSGGADSLALMHSLYTLQSLFGYHLHVATLDHGLRGAEGAADVRYVETLAQSWGIPVTAGQVDVRGYAQRQRMGVEAAARVARYDFLARVAQQVGAERIGVAHHVGDQAETVLMHLIRGTGITGLSGMRLLSPVPGHPDLILIRPLLWVTRNAIEAYCAEHGLQAREDLSNRDTAIARNYIRWEILPRLEVLNPNVQSVLNQTADILQSDYDFIKQQLETFVSSPAVNQFEGRISVQRTAFRDLHPALQRRFVTWAARTLRSALDDLGYQHVVKAVRLGVQGRQGARALLTDGLQLRVDYDVLLIEDEAVPPLVPNQPLIPAGVEIEVAIPGGTIIPGGQWSIQASTTAEATQYEDSSQTVLQLSIPASADVRLRGRRAGDRFAPMNMGGHTQKLNRWMINHKIPQHLREQIPLLTVNGDIAAIVLQPPQWYVGQNYVVKDNSRRVVYFHFLENS